MPRFRHARLLVLALPIALGVAVWPRAEASPVPQVGPGDAAAARPVAAAPRRAEPYVPNPDPDHGRGDLEALPPLSPSVLTGYVWPLPHGRLTLPFEHSRWGSRLVDGGLFHDGIDLATFCGDRIVAAHDGVVLAAGRRYDAFMGWRGDLAPYVERLDEKKAWNSLPIVVVIDDGNGYRSVYAHFSKVVVKAGQRVKAGEFIGYEGMTGRASGCHLHYGLFSPLETGVFEIAPHVVKALLVPRYQTARVNPLDVLPKSREPEKEPEFRPQARPTPKVPLPAPAFDE